MCSNKVPAHPSDMFTHDVFSFTLKINEDKYKQGLKNI